MVWSKQQNKHIRFGLSKYIYKILINKGATQSVVEDHIPASGPSLFYTDRKYEHMTTFFFKMQKQYFFLITDSGFLTKTLVRPIWYWSLSMLTDRRRWRIPCCSGPLQRGHVSAVRMAYLDTQTSGVTHSNSQTCSMLCFFVQYVCFQNCALQL